MDPVGQGWQPQPQPGENGQHTAAGSYPSSELPGLGTVTFIVFRWKT